MNTQKTDNFLHLVLVLGLILLNQFTLYSQSKKKQIEILNFKIDSVNKKLANDRKIHQDEINTLINKNKEQDIKRLSNQNILNQLTLENKKSNSQLDDLKSESESIIKEIENLRDSLIRLTEEEIKSQTNFKTVKIGNQTWMVENLNVANFRNGDRIPEAKTDEEWKKAGEQGKPAWCYYNNDTANGKIYGKLYNWYAVNDPRGITPKGWHIPSDSEWLTLINFLGGYSLAGKKMKNTNGWNKWSEYETCKTCKNDNRKKTDCKICKNTREILIKEHSGNGSNSSGFLGIPGGSRSIDGSFILITNSATWWSSSELNQLGKIFILTTHPEGNILTSNLKGLGSSVRCIKD